MRVKDIIKLIEERIGFAENTIKVYNDRKVVLQSLLDVIKEEKNKEESKDGRSSN